MFGREEERLGRSVPNRMGLQNLALEKLAVRMDSAAADDDYSEPGLWSAVLGRFPRSLYSIQSAKPRGHLPCLQGGVVEGRWDDIPALPAGALIVHSMYSVEVVEVRNGVKQVGGSILDEECSSGCDMRPGSELGILPDEVVEVEVRRRLYAVNYSTPDTVVDVQVGVSSPPADEAAD